MVKIGLIGLGAMGGTHATCYEALLESGNFKVAAVADLDIEKAEKTARKFGAKIFKTGKELIESGEVNTVDICLPTYLHTEHALAAMEKGCNVMIEKPVCLREEEALKLLAMQKKTGARVAVAQCVRFWPEYMYLKEIIDNKTYGKLISAVFKRVSPLPIWGWDKWYLDGKRSGSAALDLHIHDVDYVRYVLGEPDSVKSCVTSIDGCNLHVYSLYSYGDAIVSIEGGWDYPEKFPFAMEYRATLEKAAVVYSCNKTPTLTVYKDDGTTECPALDTEFNNDTKAANISNIRAYYNEIKYFIECIQNNEEIKVSPLKEAVGSFRLVQKELKTASEGKRCHVANGDKWHTIILPKS